MPLNRLLADDGYWTDCRTRAMGCEARILLGDAPEGLADWAVEELERLEQCWSRFRPDSELSRLNARAGEWAPVSPTMLLALTCARDLVRATGGRFDPTILRALERAGYDRTFADVAPVAAGEFVPEPATGFGKVEIDTETARVRLPPATTIDLGGVGKGLAADLVSRGLADRGARSVLVGLGGDLRARGEPPPAGAWDIPVEHPFDGTRVAFHYPLERGAIVTSTCRIRAWTRNGVRYHHLIDPASGDSARTSIAAVVAAATDAWWAEGVAKAMIIAGPGDGVALARACRVRAWICRDDASIDEVGHEP